MDEYEILAHVADWEEDKLVCDWCGKEIEEHEDFGVLHGDCLCIECYEDHVQAAKGDEYVYLAS